MSEIRVEEQSALSFGISVVIPLYNEVDSLQPLCEAVHRSLNATGRTFEVIFIDDGSTDGSAEALLKLKEEYPNIRVVQFQRNYGKSAALSVGFSRAQGEIVITMDADLQDDPEEIPRLIAKIEEGYDLVSGWKKTRRDPISKRLPSKLFNRVTSLLSGVRIHDHNCGLKAYRNSVVKNVSVYGELHRFIPALSHAQGFSVTEIPVKHHARQFGKTKYGLWRFFSGFFDLMTVIWLTRFTRSPLHIFGLAGLGVFSLGFAINLYLTYIKYVHNQGIGDRPLLFLGVLLVILGFQFFSLGFLGEMIANIHQQDEHYIIKNEID